MAHLLSLASMTLEILNGVLVFFGRRGRLERAEIGARAGLRIDLARIEPVAAGLELADHRRLLIPPVLRGILRMKVWTIANPEERLKVPPRVPTRRANSHTRAPRVARPRHSGRAAIIRESECRWATLAPKHDREGLSLLPALARQVGDIILGLGKSKAEIRDELPVRRDIENRCNGCRLEDRYPAHANPLRARREPNGVDGCYRRILDHLRHGLTPQPMSLHGRTIGEYRQVAGRVVQSGQLEPGIGGRLLRSLRRKRLGVAAFEIFPNGCATHRIVDDHEAPRLAQADRRRQARQMD